MAKHYSVVCFLILEIVGVVFCEAWRDASLDLILEHLGMDQGYEVDKVQSRISSNSQIIANTNSNEIDTVYPKMLVHVHHTISGDRPSERMKALLEYILTFWNSVDLIFRSVKNPKIRLHIVVIMIAEEPRATPYILRNMVKNDDKHYNGSNAINDASRFYYAMKDLYPFDLAVTMANLTLFTYPPPSYERVVAGGLSFLTGCLRNDETKHHFGVALAWDNGAYTGIHDVAHEVGHLMGGQHETVPVHSNCPIQRGLLMDEDPKMSKNRTRISVCSQYDFRKSFEDGGLSCMYEKPPMFGKKLPNVMAGKPLNRNYACQALNLGPSCKPHEGYIERLCSQLYCQAPESEIGCMGMMLAIPAGTPCFTESDNAPGICLNYECIPL